MRCADVLTFNTNCKAYCATRLVSHRPRLALVEQVADRGGRHDRCALLVELVAFAELPPIDAFIAARNDGRGIQDDDGAGEPKSAATA